KLLSHHRSPLPQKVRRRHHYCPATAPSVTSLNGLVTVVTGSRHVSDSSVTIQRPGASSGIAPTHTPCSTRARFTRRSCLRSLGRPSVRCRRDGTAPYRCTRTPPSPPTEILAPGIRSAAA